MTARPRPAPRPRPRRAAGLPFACALLAIALCAAAGLIYVLSPGWGRSNAQAEGRDVGTVPTSGGGGAAALDPRSIVIPRLAVRAPVVPVATTNRELDIPQDPGTVGWWRGGARPGAARGTAILAGHVNYAGVTGALARIGTLDPGDVVYLTGLDGTRPTRLTFRITGVRTYTKAALPYREIFDQDSVGRLAIVTCGGPFDASTGNYEDNIVAFAVPAGSVRGTG